MDMTAEEAVGEALSEAPQDDRQESDERPGGGAGRRGGRCRGGRGRTAAAGAAEEKAEPDASRTHPSSSTGELDSSSDAGDAGAEAPPGDQPA